MHLSLRYRLLDSREAPAAQAPAAFGEASGEPHKRRAILCAACGARVSDSSQRIRVAGQHQHTFFNPAGVVFSVVCFAAARGCRGVGPFSEEFTWFPGYRWQISLCASCSEHLGWHFQGDSTFTALIERRIVEVESESE